MSECLDRKSEKVRCTAAQTVDTRLVGGGKTVPTTEVKQTAG